MPEMPDAGEYHGDAVIVGGGFNHFIVVPDALMLSGQPL